MLYIIILTMLTNFKVLSVMDFLEEGTREATENMKNSTEGPSIIDNKITEIPFR